MKKEFCELPGCEKEIPSWRHGNATTCCDEHGKQLNNNVKLLTTKKYVTLLTLL